MQQYVGRRLGDRLYAPQHAAQCGARADNLAKIHRDIDLLAKVVAFAFQLVAQSRIFGERLLEFALGAIALGDVFGSHQHVIEVALFVAVNDRR